MHFRLHPPNASKLAKKGALTNYSSVKIDWRIQILGQNNQFKVPLKSPQVLLISKTYSNVVEILKQWLNFVNQFFPTAEA